ncbi:MAG: hypothetical protein AAF488_17620 [Planctomycetota bacterium]
MPTFHWDFFGPPAQPKALHFRSHLEETLRNWGIDAETGVRSDGVGHHSAWLRSSSEHAEKLRTTLRPNRITEDEAATDDRPELD